MVQAAAATLGRVLEAMPDEELATSLRKTLLPGYMPNRSI